MSGVYSGEGLVWTGPGVNDRSGTSSPDGTPSEDAFGWWGAYGYNLKGVQTHDGLVNGVSAGGPFGLGFEGQWWMEGYHGIMTSSRIKDNQVVNPVDMVRYEKARTIQREVAPLAA
jgi:hypothetical protein